MSVLSAIPIVGDLINLGSTYMKGKTEIKKAEMNNTAKLLGDEQSNNSSWEMANLTDKDKWLRRGSFLMFAMPFIWAMFDPEAVKNYFDVALEAMPEWYVKLFGIMIGGVWGVAALKNTVMGIFGGLKK